MAGATLTNKLEILQDNFGEGVSFLVNVKTRVLNQFPISPKKFDGRVIRENIGIAMPAGGGSLGPSASSVPSPSTSSNRETYIYHTYHFDTIQIDWDTADQSSGRHAYIDAVKQELKRVAQYRPREMERQILGAGDGYLSEVPTTSATASVPIAVTTPGWQFTVANWQAPKFPINSRIEFWDAHTATASKRDTPSKGYYTVSLVELKTDIDGVFDSTLARITVEEGSPGTNSPVGTDWVARDEHVVENVAAGLNASNEMNGLDILIDDGNELLVKNTKMGFATASTFQNLAADGSYWQAQVTDGSGQYLNIDLVEESADDISINSGMDSSDVMFLVAHQFQVRKYKAGLYPQERFPNTGNAGSFTAGSTTTFNDDYGPMISQKPVIKSEFCPPSTAFIVGPGIMHYDLKPWGFWTGDGNMWRMNQQGRPAKVAHAYAIKAVGTTRRNQSAKIENLDTV